MLDSVETVLYWHSGFAEFEINKLPKNGMKLVSQDEGLIISLRMQDSRPGSAKTWSRYSHKIQWTDANIVGHGLEAMLVCDLHTCTIPAKRVSEYGMTI